MSIAQDLLWQLLDCIQFVAVSFSEITELCCDDIRVNFEILADA